MEENKNQIQYTETNKFLLKRDNNLVNVSTNKFSNQFLNLNNSIDNNSRISNLLRDSINKNDKNNNENNINIFTSPKKIQNFFIKSTFINSAFQTPSFQKDINKNPLNIETNNNNQLSRNIQSISNSFQNKILKLKRMNTANIHSISNNQTSDFMRKERMQTNSKIYSKIDFQNTQKLDFDKNKIHLLKSERNIKTIASSLITDRNKKDTVKFSLSRRNSISENKNKKKIMFKRSMTISRPKMQMKRKPNLKIIKKFPKKKIEPIIVNPLLIAEEDKIFNEMKKYLCFKYEQKKKLNNKSNETKKIKKIDNNKENLNIKKYKIKIQTTEQIKLDYLYLSNYKMNRKIRHIQRKKDTQDLAEYQNNLLDVIKPSVSDYAYSHLKDRLFDIRLKNIKIIIKDLKKLKMKKKI